MQLTLSALLLPAIGYAGVAHPKGETSAMNNLTSPYTLTAYLPCNPVYNGLKVNNLNLFQENVSQYCPEVVSICPNGTDTVFASSMYPV
jgi:hypothetical protein